MYKCDECKHEWDVCRYIGDPEVRQCPICYSYEIYKITKPITPDIMLADAPSLTDDNIQELREIILDSGSSNNYQNKQIREWFSRHFR